MRSQAVNSGIKYLIVGGIIALFGWIDITYWLTPLTYEIDQLIITIGGLMCLGGIGYSIYGLVAKDPTSYSPAQIKTSPSPLRKPVPPSINESKVNTQPTQPQIHEREIIKEIEVIYCAYCATKNSARSNYCINCRAKLH